MGGFLVTMDPSPMNLDESFRYISHMWSTRQPSSLEEITNLANEMTATWRLPDLYVIDMRADDPAMYRIVVLRDSVNVRDTISGKAFSELPAGDYYRKDIVPNLLHIRDSKEIRRNVVRLRTGPLNRLIAHERMDLPALGAGKVEWVLSAVNNLVSLPIVAPGAQQLSLGETKILKLLYEGQSAKEIARLCLISPRTVEHRIESIKEKLGARNVAHAAAIGLGQEIAGSLES